MTEAELLADLRELAFGRGAAGAPPLIGAEIELIPVDAGTGLLAHIWSPERPCTLPFLRRTAELLGWRETSGAAPKFHTSDGSLIAFEPGGQIEVSAPPTPSVGALVSSLRATVLPLREAALDAGIRLLEMGLDPVSAPSEVPLQLRSERYLLMDRHFARIGTAGARMMRQTASFHVNVDWTGDLPLQWEVLNAAAPFLTAIFASSPVYRGADTGAQSFRALGWTELDPLRTGIVLGHGDPAIAYLRFALAAPAILTPGADGRAAPFAARLAQGRVGREEWHAHLTTLFPEVRPKGYAELRCIDAIPAEWYAAPLALLAGLSHPAALHAAAIRLGPPRPSLLRRAARRGLRDPAIGAIAIELFHIGLDGAHSLGEPMLDRESLDAAREYFDRYTRRGRAPADDLREQGGIERQVRPRPLDSCR